MLYNLFIFAFYIIGWGFVIFSKTKSITLKNYLKRIFFHLKKNKEKSFLFHFSSLGEMKAAEGIIKYLRAKNKNIVITVFTETAYLSAKERYDNVVLMPVDFYPVVKHFVKKINPAIAFITETEIWPSYIISLSKHSRVIWINARISERSYKRYTLLKPLLRYVFENVDSVFVQTMDDLKRFSKFIDHKKIVIAGNTKYDSDLFIEIPNDILNILKTWKSNIFTVILGSIHPDEFEYFVKAYKLLKNEKLNIKLLVVPRHIEKISEFEMILNRHNIDYIRFSDIQKDKKIRCEYFDFMIFDLTGYLSGLYIVCDLAFVGGTLNKVGGHNLLEPAFHSKPVIFGPSYQLQKTAAESLIERACGFIVSDEYEIKSRIKYFMYSQDMRKKAGESSKKVFCNLTGAKEIIIKAIEGKV